MLCLARSRVTGFTERVWRMENGLKTVLGSNDIPSASRLLHPFRPQTCSVTIPKAITRVTRLTWRCFR
jgi:hypothetical protein